MKREGFNEGWMFLKDGSTLAESMFSEGGGPTAVTLPHDAMVHEYRKADNPSGKECGFFAGGNYTYTKNFSVSEDDAGKSIILEFEGVYRNARVYVNGDFAGSCTNGYRNFYIDITPFLNFGTDNTITVKVNNGDVPNSRWYTGSGIYRPVNLLKGGRVRITADGLKITTPEVAESLSTVETEITFESSLSKPEKFYFVTEITDMNGQVAAAEKTPVTIFPGRIPKLFQKMYIKNALLWSTETPNLYQCSVTILEADDCLTYGECADKNRVIDRAVSNFGIRHIQIDPVYGLRLNGEKVLLRGACIHHDNGVLGAATFAGAEERRIELLKEAGFNSIRMAHNAASRALLNACDKMGILLMEESFDMWNNSKTAYDGALNFTDEWKKDIDALIAKDYNHPCVFMYSIGNEIQEAGTPAGAALNREIANRCRQLDPNRYVTNAVNGLLTIMDQLDSVMEDIGKPAYGQTDKPTVSEAGSDEIPADGDVNDAMTMLMGQMNLLAAHHTVEEKLEETISGIDLAGYNYMSGRYALDAEKYPNRIMYGSETLPPDIDINWKYVKEIPQVLGDYTWTGWDYLGEAGVGVVEYNSTSGFYKPFPVYMGYCGDIDIIGNRRPMSYYREIVWGLRKEPYVAVQYPQHYNDKPFCTPWSAVDSLSSWTWPGFEGKSIRVEVYSEAEETELFLNNNALGKMPTGEMNRFKAVFDITYQPGTLEAVSYTNGQETGRFTMETAGDAKEIMVNCDRTCLHAGEEDLAYLQIDIGDENGKLNTAAEAVITVNVEGAGELQGFGSANPMSTENFFDKSRTTYNGRLLAVIRAGKEPGIIKAVISAEGFEDTAVEIYVEQERQASLNTIS